MNTLSNDYIKRALITFGLFISGTGLYAWGFYGHKLINQQAVYSLPLPLQSFFISHIDYLSRHAVDPDKRRYAVKEEGFQHFFDSEKWVDYIGDCAVLDRRELLESGPGVMIIGRDSSWIPPEDSIHAQIVQSIPRWFSGSTWEWESFEVLDTMAQHGVLPITINKWYHKLVHAFVDQDLDLILKIAAEIGHYIGDAHVPLHTTVNYNGQLTGQVGIHAFWETHVPEWMAESHFDFLVGPAEYLADVPNFSWGLIRHSHQKVDSVLRMEREVRDELDDDREVCVRPRSGQFLNLPSPELLEAYHSALNDMVERQLRRTIRHVASIWWSAYVDAGQPILTNMKRDKPQENQEDKPMEPANKAIRCD